MNPSVNRRPADAFAELARRSVEPTLRMLAADERQREPTPRALAAYERQAKPVRRLVAMQERQTAGVEAALRTAGWAAAQYDAAVRHLKLPAVQTASRARAKENDRILEFLAVPALRGTSRVMAEQYPDIIGHLDSAVPSALLAHIEEAGRALADSEQVAEPAQWPAAAEDDDGDLRRDDLGGTLDAFIAAALAGKDIATAAWLLTVRQIRRVYGHKAARETLAMFIALAATFVLAAWLVNDADKPVSEAFNMAAPIPIAVLGILRMGSRGK
ncbi:hypothetical protein [Blastococcus montanus]|uniref:hypothetical protein n=1 Tax=Blastococcus montanus TaxID=3144973 RepID=UPI003209B454